MANKHTISDLYQMQSLPLSAKIRMTQIRINGWVDEFGEEGIYANTRGFTEFEIGKTVFLTKEEAEQKLKEMESDTNGKN